MLIEFHEIQSYRLLKKETQFLFLAFNEFFTQKDINSHEPSNFLFRIRRNGFEFDARKL